MTEDRFWVLLDRLGYQVKWQRSYVEILIENQPLAIIDRLEEGAYTIMKEGLMDEKAITFCKSLAHTPLEERQAAQPW